jgi:hypothetical protein
MGSVNYTYLTKEVGQGYLKAHKMATTLFETNRGRKSADFLKRTDNSHLAISFGRRSIPAPESGEDTIQLIRYA